MPVGHAGNVCGILPRYIWAVTNVAGPGDFLENSNATTRVSPSERPGAPSHGPAADAHTELLAVVARNALAHEVRTTQDAS
jgi:hypothetical protein